jgi:hypothetical protein
MNSDRAQLNGELDSGANLSRIADKVRPTGMSIQIRESTHYTEGRYLLVEMDNVEFRFERISSTECLVSGESDRVDQLSEAAIRLSQTFAASDVRHRFEIYDGDNRLLGYLHHRWAQGPVD